MRAGWLLIGLCACGRIGFDPPGVDPLDAADAADVADAPPRAGFAFRKAIAIDPAKNVGGTDLARFPLAVQIADGDLRSTGAGGKLATGVDLAFLDADGVTPLAFEIDQLDVATGDLRAWVKLPVFSASVDTRFYLAFGDPNVTSSQADAASVWADGYVGVWHFSEAGYTGATGECAEATGAHPGTASGTATTIPGGKFGRAASISADNSPITIPASPALQPPSITVSAWARARDIGTSGNHIATIVSQDGWRAPGTSSQGYYLEIYRTVSQPEPTFYAANGPAIAHAFSTSSASNNTWFYAAGTYEAPSGMSRIYVDGVLRGSAGMTGAIAYLPKPILVGFTPTIGWWNGDIDELRISNVVRSPAWIATEHASQIAPGSFATIGPTEL